MRSVGVRVVLGLGLFAAVLFALSRGIVRRDDLASRAWQVGYGASEAKVRRVLGPPAGTTVEPNGERNLRFDEGEERVVVSFIKNDVVGVWITPDVRHPRSAYELSSGTFWNPSN